jgi:hypothetical protein
MKNLSDGDGMQKTFEKGLAMAVLVAATGICANGQAVPATLEPAPHSEMLVTSTTAASAVSSGAAGHVLRVIDDPHTGARWLLMRDDRHPAGPGRLLLTAQPDRDRAIANMNSNATQFDPVPVHPVIRMGDRVVVEENSAVAEVRLEAVALGPAGVGSEFNVRLKIGGKVLRAKALGAGSAAFLTEAEVRR